MSNKINELSLFKLKDPALGEWKDIPDTFVYNEEGRQIGMSPRKIQLAILKQLAGKSNTIIDAPGGSGKSMASMFLHLIDLINNPNKKLIIAVPKKIIQKGFKPCNLYMPNEGMVGWVPVNLCGDTTEKKKELIGFWSARSFPRGINERILITTHQALGGLFTELVEQKLLNKKIFHNTSIVVDEAHKLLNAEQEETGIILSNEIGSFISYALRCQEKDTTVGVHLMTATAFRGDTYSLLLKKDIKKFTTYYLPIDEHWKENIKYIEDYSYNYIIYRGTYWKGIEQIKKRHTKNNILFFLPRGETKYKVAKKIKKLLKKHKAKVKVCDLAEDRDLAVRDRLKDDINENEDNYDVVLSVDIFNEGADWPPCEVIIDLEPACSSLPKAIQRWLRAFRDKDYKKHLHYYSFLPFVLDTLDEDKYLTALNKNFTAFMLSMVIQDVVNPIPIPRPKGKEKGSKREEKIDYLIESVKNIHKRTKIQTDVRIDLISLKAQADKDDKILTTKDIEKSIKLTLKKNKVKKHVDEIVLQIYVALKRQVPKYSGVDVSKLVEEGYEEVKNNNVADEIFEGIMLFPAMITGKTFAELKEMYAKAYKEPYEWVEVAEKLAKEHNGMLPHGFWLTKNGYVGMVPCMRNHPELFRHIKQDNFGKSPQENIKITEQLAIDNGGILQNSYWLTNNGYKKIVQCMRNHPKLFKHIKQEKKYKSPKEQVKVAEQLALEHPDGLLRHDYWLLKNGPKGLTDTMRNHPELFKHIKREVIRKKPQEYVKIAEQIAKEQPDGVLPYKEELVRMGRNSLTTHIRKYPKLFAHITQKKSRKTLDEKVNIAKNIAKSNGGILPSNK